MWLKQLKYAAASLSLIAGMSVFSSIASAASVSFEEYPTADPANGIPGQITDNTSDTLVFTVTLEGSETEAVYDISAAQVPPVSGFEIFAWDDVNDVTTGSALYTASEVGTAPNSQYLVRATFTSTGTFAVVTSGSNGFYTVKMSAVPLPAAAWMFLSMLFGGAWIKRRSSRSQGGVVATA